MCKTDKLTRGQRQNAQPLLPDLMPGARSSYSRNHACLAVYWSQWMTLVERRTNLEPKPDARAPAPPLLLNLRLL